MENKEFYNIALQDNKGNTGTMASYAGQVLLIVNTATGCGFTPQYADIQALYDKYQAQGFTVLDFPCNQFANQAPGSAEEISTFCTLHYNTTFPQFAKCNVNGKNAHPLFVHLKKKKGGLLFSSIKWNFTKFLVDRQGNVVARFAPTVPASTIEKEIQKYI